MHAGKGVELAGQDGQEKEEGLTTSLTLAGGLLISTAVDIIAAMAERLARAWDVRWLE